jgi:hypothetical protein
MAELGGGAGIAGVVHWRAFVSGSACGLRQIGFPFMAKLFHCGKSASRPWPSSSTAACGKAPLKQGWTTVGQGLAQSATEALGLGYGGSLCLARDYMAEVRVGPGESMVEI